MVPVYEFSLEDIYDMLSYFVAVTLVMCLTFVLIKMYRKIRERHYEIPARDAKKGHYWTIIDLWSKSTYCNVSEERLVSGAVCDACGICADDSLLVKANSCIPCKPLSAQTEKDEHHWVKGNLVLGSHCCVCQTELQPADELAYIRCCWCQKTAHEECMTEISQLCDLGPYRDMIVPSRCVKLKLVGIKGHRRWIVDSVTKPNNPHWKPLIVIVNHKSGNGDGQMVLSAFRAILNPIQMMDLSKITPEAGLEWCRLLPDVKCQVLVAGGDGTVGWILQAIDKLKLETTPEVGLLPLGTGNDLSRVLGWGEGHSSSFDVQEVLQQLDKAKATKLDRWKICIEPKANFSRRRQVVMNNYASIGVDALVTLNFHRQRQQRPGLFGGRFINKLWYFTYGTKDVLSRECINLHRNLEVELDGQPFSLPEIEGLVVLNISSWGGGCRPWTLGDPAVIPPACHSDKVLEVFALYSSFHIAQLQVGLKEPIRVGQAKRIKITLKAGKAPMQVDGEPWEQTPATISICHHNQAVMLRRVC